MIVKLKIESLDHYVFFKKRKMLRIKFVFIITSLIITTVLVVIEKSKINITSAQGDPNLPGGVKILSVITNVFTIIVEGILIYLIWNVFSYFYYRKK